MKRWVAHIVVVVMLLGLAACKQKDLYDMTPQGDVPVDVVIHWDNAQTDGFVKPTNMTVH